MDYLNPHDMTPRQRRIGSTRRLRALAWMGWAAGTIAVRYMIRDDDPAEFLANYDRGVTCTTDTWYAVALAYDDLSMSFGPDLDARIEAIARRWAPPLAWDDDRIDDVFAKPLNSAGRRDEPNTPDHAVVWRRLHGDTTVPMRRADFAPVVREGHRRGWTDNAIAARTGISADAACRVRNRLGLPRIEYLEATA